MEHPLQVYLQGEMIFYSDRNWLYPILELEEYLKKKGLDPQDLLVHDKIVGRAAALLMVRMQIGEIRAENLSHAGQQVLDHYDIPYTFINRLQKVACQTEEYLIDELDTEKAYQYIMDRVKKRQTNS